MLPLQRTAVSASDRIAVGYCALLVGWRRIIATIAMAAVSVSMISGEAQSQFLREPSESQSSASPIDLRVRIVWGGTIAASYVGSVELDQGSLVCDQQLGIDVQDPGFLIGSSETRLAIADNDTRFGGCDVHVQGNSNSRLSVRLRAFDADHRETTWKEYSWLLRDLRDHSHVETLDLGDCKVSVDRVPGDRLRSITSRTHLIYNTDEPLGLQIQPHALPWDSTTGVFEYTLVRLSDDQEIVRQSRALVFDELGNAEPIKILHNAPREEGVYELRCKVEPKRIFPGILIRAHSIERTIQFLVYDSAPRGQKVAGRGEQVDQTQADSQRWRFLNELKLSSLELHTQTERLLEQLEATKRNPLLEAARSLKLGRKENVSAASLDVTGSTLVLAPGSYATKILTDLVPGEMHRLRVSAVGYDASFRAVLMAEPHVTNKKQSGVVYCDETLDVTPQKAIHRRLESTGPLGQEILEVLFWPSTNKAVLEISNLSASQSVELDAVSVEVWQDWHERSDETADLELNQATANTLELHSPNVRGVFGPGWPMPALGAYDDWRTLLRFADSAAEYSQANGFDCFAMVVDGEGGTLFPSTKLSSNCRLDTGIFSKEGRDPMRKDFVELMYRCLTRHGIHFVPILELSGQIVELEAPGQTADAELYQSRDPGAEGATKTHPKYNPLSQRVQRAMAVGLEEFEARYRSNPSYRGLAILISDASHLHVSLESDETNPTILDRFSSETNRGAPLDSNHRNRIVGPQAQAMYRQWLHSSVIQYLRNLRVKPRWISVAGSYDYNMSVREQDIIVPYTVGSMGMDFTDAKLAILSRWNMHFPSPVHVSLTHPEFRFDRSIPALMGISESFVAKGASSLTHRDGANSISRVRVWEIREQESSLLISNANAVSETIVVEWDEVPLDYRVASTCTLPRSDPRGYVEPHATDRSWRIFVPAGEAIRIDFVRTNQRQFNTERIVRPLSWYSYDAMTVRSIQTAIQSVEEAVNRLSTPQSRYEGLRNSSFETQSVGSRRGRLDGWTTSLDPDASVAVDLVSAYDGEASIKIDSRKATSIAWLQSDPFSLVAKDRLSVSLHVASTSIPEQLSISIWRFEPKIERFESIEVHDFSETLRRNLAANAWSPIRLDVGNLLKSSSDPNSSQLFRLQFEAKGKGNLWLDSVVIATDYLREEERRDLRNELFLAKGAMQNGDYGPAIAMLHSLRGQLFQWCDAAVEGRAVFVSGPTTDVSGKSGGNSPKESLPTDPKDASQKPAKRTRNLWWPSRNKK